MRHLTTHAPSPAAGGLSAEMPRASLRGAPLFSKMHQLLLRGFGSAAALSRTSSEDRQRAEALSAARAKRNAALAEYAEAKRAGDTRRMHDAHRSARHATVDLVRLELGQS